jgi:hypothetical protein
MKQQLVHIVQPMIVLYNVLMIIHVIHFYRHHVYLVRMKFIRIFIFVLNFEVTNGINKQAKSIIITSRIANTYVCTNSFGGAYANWWTYSTLLLNWFILLCFFLYLCNHFVLNQNTIVLTSSIVGLTFLMMIVYAFLWGFQCM